MTMLLTAAPDTEDRLRVVAPGEGRRLRIGNDEEITILATGNETLGACAMGLVTYAPGAEVPAHIHHFEDELLYVLEGTFAVRIGDNTGERLLTAGTLALLPGGVAHSLRNTGGTWGRIFGVLVPGGGEEVFPEMARAALEAGRKMTREERGLHFVELAARYGVEFAAPESSLPVTGDPTRTRIVAPSEGMTYWSINHGITVKATSDETKGACSFVTCDAPPGAGVPPHIHHAEDEYFYILSGEIAADVNGREVTLGPGSFVLLPRGVPHSWFNKTEELARLLILTTPGGIDRMFADIDFATADPKLSPAEVIAGVTQVCTRYEVELLPPPAGVG